jgi:hypothetical protein
MIIQETYYILLLKDSLNSDGQQFREQIAYW